MKYKSTLTLLIAFTSLFGGNDNALQKEKETPKPACSSTAVLSCPKGYQPSCPPKHKPSCIFVGTGQLPACLEDNTDNFAFNYYLDRIMCQKESAFKKNK